jgi:vacuolar-type H+-ATPase catalytic subunit A/Vma1
LIRDYLQQNIFTQFDNYSPVYKSLWMLHIIIQYYSKAKMTLEMEGDFNLDDDDDEDANKDDKQEKITLNKIKEVLGNLYTEIESMKFKVKPRFPLFVSSSFYYITSK